MALYSDAFLDNLPEDPKQGVIDICDSYNESCENYHGKQLIEIALKTQTIECHTLLCEYIEHHKAKLPSFEITPLNEDDPKYNFFYVRDLTKSVKKRVQPLIDKSFAEKKRQEYSARFSNEFAYTFSDGDIKRIQELLNQLREFISEYKGFEEQHRRRLLKRLEKLQSELHKKVSDLDQFWGLVGDAGVALGKFGKDAKPIVDRIKEMTQIVWRTQSDAEGLPSSTSNPMLGHEESSDEYKGDSNSE